MEHGGDPAAALAAVALPEGAGVDTAWSANVTGAAHGDRLAAAVRARFGVDLHQAAVQRGLAGLAVAYAEPSRLGVDRWLTMLALWCELRGAFVVASAGTALTFDAVDGRGQHLGGVIAPGLLTAQRAVLGATRFDAAAPAQSYTAGLGSDTDACVRQGALHACIGLIERLAARFAPAGMPRVLTGGDAARLAAAAEGGWMVRDDLVLAGLLHYRAFA